MIVTPPAFFLTYEYLHKKYRLLHHETLGEVLRYPKLPRQTINFDCYPVNKIRHKHNLSLGGSVTTVHSKTISDAVISEVWLADSISMTSGFLYELIRFYNATLDTGDHLIWYPKDKTAQAFSIQPLDIICGDSNNMMANPKHAVLNWDYRYITSEVRFNFVVRRIYDIPQAVASLEGA